MQILLQFLGVVLCGVDQEEDYKTGLLADFTCEDTAYDETGKTIRVVQNEANPIKLTTFKKKKCLFFNGNGVIVVPNFGNFMGSSFSVCFWIAKPSSITWEGAISKRKGNGAADYYFGFNTNASVHNSPGMYNSSWFASNINLEDNRWYHVCFSVDSYLLGATLYIDGKEIGFLGINSACTTNTEDHLLIGGGYSGTASNPQDYMSVGIGLFSELLHGYIRQIRIYSGALQASQVETIKNATEGPTDLLEVTTVTPEYNQPSTLSLSLDEAKSYYWNLDMASVSEPSVLSCAKVSGIDCSWNVDIYVPDSVLVQLDDMFDTDASDALTAGKVNYCTVRWNGKKAILKVTAIGEK